MQFYLKTVAPIYNILFCVFSLVKPLACLNYRYDLSVVYMECTDNLPRQTTVASIRVPSKKEVYTAYQIYTTNFDFLLIKNIGST